VHCEPDHPPELNVVECGPMQLLPPAPGNCALCAVAHTPHDGHDAGSLFYQTRFQLKHGRYPTWADAVAHLPPETATHWVAALTEAGLWRAADERIMREGTGIAEPTTYAT
jgi:hypothetical protein